MIVSMETEILREAVNKILPVVDKRNSRPILTHALFEVSEGKLEISATDLEVSAKVIVPALVEKPGTLCIKIKNLAEILRELPNGQISIMLNTTENTLQIKHSEISFTLVVYKNEDYPQLMFINKDNTLSMQSKHLLEIIGKTSYAISTDENRLFLNGLFLQQIDSQLRAVATDGHRLSLIETEIGDNISDNSLVNGIIVPRKGVFELKKLAESYRDEEVSISVDDSFIYVNIPNKHYLAIRLIARDYPKYQAVIPAKTSFQLNVNNKQLSDAVKRIKIMSNEKSNGIRIELSEEEMLITANHPSLGNAKEKITVNYQGKAISMGFNAKYLIDTLSVIDDEDILIEFNNETSPIVVKSPLAPNSFGIIMPLKL